MTKPIRSIDWAFIGLGLIAIAALLFTCSGCTKSRTEKEETKEKNDHITVSGSVTVPTPEGPRPYPVSLSIDRSGTERGSTTSETKSTIDGQALGREIATAVSMALAATSGGTSIQGIAGMIGQAASGAGLLYLAHQKRKQLKQGQK